MESERLLDGHSYDDTWNKTAPVTGTLVLQKWQQRVCEGRHDDNLTYLQMLANTVPVNSAVGERL